ncbi:P-loop NTPase fold protein [Pseudodesulfovibrio senegalensis]|uniref:KAP NTPase domain-containing protein n=1 Tax=Pseudodesulfovibrio senegalensis TaxID=1721087 RepID=A0A6N6N2R0_9BACT|nr:P-loop NTPase fold protein [Pseudodesulfovibrio senegalensis]KAB1441857.1 hypothetical protein F8A88_09735 [Pseudodesulfovibrio senegalensis]
MDQNESSKLLKTLLATNDGCVLLLKGPWGIGKTHFWNDFAASQPKGKHDKKYVYVSLFGKKSIEEIQNDILLQAFSQNRYIGKLKKGIDAIKTTFSADENGDISFGLTGNAVGKLLCLFEKNDFSDLVICIDDFERKSDELQHCEVMGLASILKERYGSKIILIMDEEKINEEDGKYTTYKEKLIDKEFLYTPNQKDIINNILYKINTKYKDEVKRALESVDESNLRTVKKVAQNVHIISELVKNDCSEWGMQHLAHYVALLTCLYAGLGADGLATISDINIHKKIKDKECNSEVKTYANKFASKISNLIPLHALLWEFISTSRLNKPQCLSILKEQEESNNGHPINQELCKIFHKYEFNIKTDDKEVVKKIETILDEIGCTIFDNEIFENINFYFKALGQISGDQDKYTAKYIKFKYDYVKKTLDSIVDYKTWISTYNNDLAKSLCSSDENIKIDFNEELKKRAKKIYTEESLYEHITSLNQKSGYSQADQELLNNISIDIIISDFQNNLYFPEALGTFIYNQSTIENTSFIPFMNTTKEAMEQMKEELGTFRYERFMSYFPKALLQAE